MVESPRLYYDVEGVLEPALPEEMDPGLPRKGGCGSDHLSLRAHITWSSKGTI